MHVWENILLACNMSEQTYKHSVTNTTTITYSFLDYNNQMWLNFVVKLLQHRMKVLINRTTLLF